MGLVPGPLPFPGVVHLSFGVLAPRFPRLHVGHGMGLHAAHRPDGARAGTDSSSSWARCRLNCLVGDMRLSLAFLYSRMEAEEERMLSALRQGTAIILFGLPTTDGFSSAERRFCSGLRMTPSNPSRSTELLTQDSSTARTWPSGLVHPRWHK